ncbi:DUF6092 family protein [Streptomyces chrestomyceticus]|uniref:DUF6092 family protein n=1 Tax=Streptomyces chrestomyceticus TaxID=68185 RepID=UPI0035A8BCB9
MKPSAATPSTSLHEDLALLAAYLLSTGRGLVEEPDDYPPMRCIDAARRTLRLLEAHTTAEPRLVSLRARLDDIITAPQQADAEPAVGLLDDLCQEMAQIIKAMP